MMTINKISRYILPFLVVMIFISSMSYTIDFHYCQGSLKSFALFGKAKNCHEMASKKSTCRHHKKKTIDSLACAEDKKDCCNNKTVHFESEMDQQLLTFDYLDIDDQFFAISYESSSFSGLLELYKDELVFKHYRPPLISRDIPVLFESFLI